MANQSRVIQLQKDLMSLGCWNGLKALNHMISVMNARNGYARHDGSDYYMHLVDVVQDLINHGITDFVVLTAGVLHDYLEDVEGVTYNEIKRDYGEPVADVVLGVSKNPDIDYKTDRVAFAEYLNEILKDWRKLLVKVADRKHNMSTLKDASPDKQYRQAVETEEYFLPLFKDGRMKYPEYSAYLHTAKTTLYPQILKIKEHHEYRIMMEAKVKEQERTIKLIQNLVYDTAVANEENESYEKLSLLCGEVNRLVWSMES